MQLKRFPHYKQLNATDCGPTSLRMITKYYGLNLNFRLICSDNASCKANYL
ncbi:cysteine peptidase family C39 domain-containing protein [Hallella faecis]|uniref:cysteine peptidase family C39 domain-containing protein n=1 Tax=Hallella faecis TaxID=2841596 RepID=UPI003F9398BF